MDPLVPLIAQLASRAVRFVVIGVAGANYYALGAATIFSTQDRDLFLPSDPDNLLHAWQSCEAAGLSLWVGREPLDSPRDRALAERVVDRRLAHIVTSKHAAGRAKDRLFLATHRQALEDLLRREP